MSSCTGRAWACATALLLSLPALIEPALAYAQDDEVIQDPELSGGGSGSSGSSGSGAGGDEVIEDPELGGGAKPKSPSDFGWGEVYQKKGEEAPPKQPEVEAPDPTANTGIAKLELVGQTAIDMHSEGSLEDFYEGRLRFGGEVDFRISRRLRLSLGTRLDFGWYAPHQNDPYLKDVPIYAPERADGIVGRRTIEELTLLREPQGTGPSRNQVW